MRRLSSLAACLAALAFAGVAGADTPPDVYSDFAEDGSLSCGHSRAALKGVLTDASIQQYGDPLTFLGLKLAVRKQLAGSARRQLQKTNRRSVEQGRPAIRTSRVRAARSRRAKKRRTA